MADATTRRSCGSRIDLPAAAAQKGAESTADELPSYLRADGAGGAVDHGLAGGHAAGVAAAEECSHGFAEQAAGSGGCCLRLRLDSFALLHLGVGR